MTHVDSPFIEHLCQYRDLWRFRGAINRSWGARQKVFEEALLMVTPDMNNDCKLEHYRVPGLSYVHGRLLSKDWHVVSSRPGQYKENIIVLEDRATLAALRHAMKHHDSHGALNCSIVDKMGVALALQKGRSSLLGS
jgi:hypothetical protein